MKNITDSLDDLMRQLDKLDDKLDSIIETNDDKLKIISLEGELSMVQGKYDSLCGIIKKDANTTRNEGDRFLSTYAKDRSGPWS
jgi:hypothetical protein